MWAYEKKLQFPVNIKNPNPALAKVIITQFGGPDGELAASQRYLAQRYTAPYNEVKGILTDIGLSAMILPFISEQAKPTVFSMLCPFLYTILKSNISVLYVSNLPVDLYSTLKLNGMSLSLTTTV